MADVKFKFIADDSEVRKKLNNLLKMREALSKDFTAKMDKGNVGGLIASLKEATKEANKLGGALNKGSLNPANAQLIASLVEKKKAIEDERLAQSKLRTQALEDAKLMREAKMKEIDLIRKAREERQKEVADNKVKREAAKQAKDEAKALADLAREEAKVAKEKAKRKKQLEQENSEYYKLNKALGTVRKETKDLLAEMFRMERQGHKNTLGYQKLKEKADALTKQTQFLDRGIKKIDATLGLHQRNVGNYGSALEEISPIVSEINRKLALFGTSIDELAGKPGAIKELGAAFISMGKGIMGFLLSPVGLLITTIASLFMLFQRNKRTVMEFEAGLRDISKTTGIAGQALRDLGKDIIDMSRKLQVVDAKKLTEYATVAGQLGVKGRQNILAFTESLAMLETASDISGEQGGKEIARMLTLVEGGVQNVKAFGDEIVNLGNNFAASESEILANAEAISQNVGQYRMGRQHVLAYATATKSLGIEAEVVGSTFQKTLGTFEKQIRTGKGVADILKVVGGSAADLQRRFQENASGVFQDYIRGLNKIHKAGGSVNAQMDKNSIVDIRQRRVIGTLAVGYDTLARAMNTVKDAAGAMQEEFENGANKLVNQTNRIGIAWDNLVLSIEDGQGAIGKTSVAVVGFFADMLEGITNVVKSDSWKEFFTRINPQNWGQGDAINRAKELKEVYKEIAEFLPGERVSEERVKIAVDNGYDFTTMVKESHEAYGKMLEAYKEYQYRVTNNMMAEDERTVAHYEKLAGDAKAYYDTLISAGKKYNYEIKKDAPTGTNTEEDAEIDEKAKRAAERAAEQRRQAVERQRSLQLQIDEINEKSLRGQLSRDEQEVASIRDKYSKIREEVRKFYADPKNKGLKVNMSGIAQAEDFEISEATTRQGTVKLLEQLNEQKAIYDEYNNYVEQNGVEAADRLFGKQAEIAKSYRSDLDDEYFSLLGKQKTASTGAAGIAQFTQAEEERLKELAARRDTLQHSDEQKARSRMDAALKMAQSFNDKRLEIERKYQQAREALGDDITTEQEHEIQRKESKELSQVASTELQESDAWGKLFSDLDRLTIEQIEKLVTEIEAKFDTLSGTFDPIDLAAIRSQLEEAKEIVIDSNPFKQIGLSLNTIFNSASKDGEQSADDIKIAWRNLAKATDKSFEFIANAVNSAGFLKDVLGETGQVALGTLQAVSGAAIGVALAIKGVEQSSVILAVIQAALAVVQAVFAFLDGAAKRRNEELKKEQEYYDALSETFDILIDKQKELFSEKSGKGAMEAYKEALDLVNSKQIANRKSLEAWFAQGASWKSHSNWYNYDKELGNVLSRQNLLNMSGKEWEDLLRNQPELWARLPEEVRAFGNSMIDAKSEAEELRDAIQESLTGISLDDVKSEFDNLFSQADLTFGDISDSFYKHMQKAVLRMVQDGKMTDSIKKWYDNVMNAMDDENLTKAESDALKAEYQAIVEAGQKRTKEIMDLIGYEGESSSSLGSEGISRATEEQFSEYLGINRAIFDIHKQNLAATQAQTGIQNNLLAVANNKLIALNAIQVNTANTVARLDVAVGHLGETVKHLKNIDSSLGGKYAG